jgi:hypothetical protein
MVNYITPPSEGLSPPREEIARYENFNEIYILHQIELS